MFTIQKYNKQYYKCLIEFLRKCLPQSGRNLDLNGRHKMYYDIDAFFEYFWCLFDENNIIGTVALKKLNNKHCEVKADIRNPLRYLLITS